MAGSLRFTKFLFLLFFFQDVGNIVLLKLDLGFVIQGFSSLKEVLVVLLLAQHWLWAAPARTLHFNSLCLVLLLALLFAVGTVRGLLEYPPDGVLFELRTLVLPILVFFWGRAHVEAGVRGAAQTESLARYYIDVSLLFALSALVDYLFLTVEFWTWVDIGAVSRAKGYLATSSGALPDNWNSYFFGRRAFGLSFNPLNLAYMLIPALIFAWYRRLFARLAVTAVAFVLSFSRLPTLATLAVVVLASVPAAVRAVFVVLGAIAMAVAVYLIRQSLFADPSASGHFGDVAIGLLQQLVNPVGAGIGAAGVYAGNYSALAIESAVLNTANQITLFGLVAYVLVFAPGLRSGGPLTRELRLIAAIYGITSVFAPQVLVIKSTFAFFFFLGCNAVLAERVPLPRKPDPGPDRIELGVTSP